MGCCKANYCRNLRKEDVNMNPFLIVAAIVVVLGVVIGIVVKKKKK